jgi:methylase of polypeptide subunit release factors
MITATAPSMPLILGASQQFREVRASLQQLNFTEEGICGRTGIGTIFEFKTLREGRQRGVETRDTLDALIRLLMDEENLEDDRAALLPPGLLTNMEALGLVARLPDQPQRLQATVVLYPVAGVYVVSDRTVLAGPRDRPAADLVYAAITANTGRFLSILPDEPCEAFLDLCAGTGIAAITAGARYAQRAWAADLVPRCVHFAEFNRRLNSLDNVTAAEGDLYGAVGDLTFDRIAAHPPYVPNKNRELLLRDGGQDGEEILGRIIEGLPRHLRPGGRFYCLTMATDREGEACEQRVRRWLGESQSEFDVILVANEVSRKAEKLAEAFAKARGRSVEMTETDKLFQELKVTGIFYGTVVVERKKAPRLAVTARTFKAAKAGGDAVEWFRKWEIAAAGPGCLLLLLDSRPRLPRNFALHVTHTPQDGSLIPSRFELRSTYPLAAEASIEPWVAVLIGACDGRHSGRELFASLKQQEVIASSMSESEFADVLRLLISNGFLEHEEYPLPG